MSTFPYTQEIHISPTKGRDRQAGVLLEHAEHTIARIRKGKDPQIKSIFCQFDKFAAYKNISTQGQRISKGIKNLIVFGTGGSSLGAKTLLAILPQRFSTVHPRIQFLDNLSPRETEFALMTMPPETTHFLVVSNSGYTVEVMAQAILALNYMSGKVGEDKLIKHFTFITNPKDNPLRVVGDKLGIPVLDHNPDLPGRFSAFSNVGLLPTFIGGGNILAIFQGAQAVLSQALETKSIHDIPAVQGAVFSAAAERLENCQTHVMMPYANSLQTFTKWFVQLWAESLGKKGRGTTPIAALGPIDQHSQLQMFLDGRQDKFFTFINTKTDESTLPIDGHAKLDKRLSLLHGKTLQDVVNAAYYGTVESIKNANRPCRTFQVERVDEFVTGGLLMHFMLETVMVAEMLEVAPFEQDRIEEGKSHSREYLENLAPKLI